MGPLSNKLTFLLITIFFISCNHYDEIQSSAKESTASGNSHNAGQDCMSCHHDNGSDASSAGKWWYFAGTAYNSNGTIALGGRIELWSTGDTNTRKMVYTVPIDKSGNFYTAKIINFKDGLFPVVVSADNKDTGMTSPITFDNTSCNSCHGHNADGTSQPSIKLNN